MKGSCDVLTETELDKSSKSRALFAERLTYLPPRARPRQ